MTIATTQENILPKILKHRWMWHAAFWFLYYAATLPGEIRTVLTTPDLVEKTRKATHLDIHIDQGQIIWSIVVNDISIIAYTYFIVLYLYPRYFARQQYVHYVILAFLLALALNGLTLKCDYWIIPPLFITEDWLSNYLTNVTVYPLFFFLVTMGKFFKDSLIQQQKDNQKSMQAKQAELNNLKAQLSPHFLFNTMNNFYGLAVAQSQQLPDLMLRLSELMRYSLYGTNRATVPLEDEIKYLKNYIELEKIRLEDTLQLHFETDTPESENLEIAPLILIVFVENAFKHSRNIQNEPIDIKIDLKVDAAHWLHFRVSNNCTGASAQKLPPLPNAIEEGGIGLDNVKKRLEVLYPEELHSLSLEQVGKFFTANLKIKLK